LEFGQGLIMAQRKPIKVDQFALRAYKDLANQQHYMYSLHQSPQLPGKPLGLLFINELIGF